MIKVTVEGVALDLNADTSISYTLNNSVFTSSDTSQLPGSYSFPFTVPVTGHNLKVLKHPNLVTAATKYQAGECEIYFGGTLLFSGTLTVQSSDRRSISLYVVSAQVTDIKKTKLSDLPLGGARAIGNKAALLAHAKETAQNPLDYDYVFFPILNQNFIENKSSKIFYWFQNYWNSATEEFELDDDKPIFMPFIRLEYLLSELLAQTGFFFVNEFQDTDELKNLVVYNNYSMYSQDGVSGSINLSNHVSQTNCSDFLKKVSAVFCLGIFTDFLSKKIRLVPLKKVLSRPAESDWTYFAEYEYQIPNTERDTPENLCYAEDDRDGRFAYLRSLVKPTVFTTVQTFAEIFAAPGTYYVVATHAYWLRGARTEFLYTTLGCMPQDSEVDLGIKTRNRNSEPNNLEATFAPLLDAHGYSIVAPHTYTRLPRIDQPGTVEYIDDQTDTGADIWKEQKSDCPDRFTIYRGYTEDGSGNNYPYASGLPYGPLSDTIGEVSLRWDGEYGIYLEWWREWHQLIRDGKTVVRKFNLNLYSITNFQFDKKVRVDNMDYIVKSLKINITMTGISPTEATMLSVI